MFESTCSFAHVTHITVIIFGTTNFVSAESTFSLIQISLPNFAFLEQNHQALLKDWFLKNMLLKSANIRRLFFTKLFAQIFFRSNWKQFQVFKLAQFEFKVTVPYGLWQNASSPEKDTKCYAGVEIWTTDDTTYDSTYKSVLTIWPI